MRIKLAGIVIMFGSCLIIPAVFAQEPKTISPNLNWDLSYTSVLERNKVSRDEFIWKWLAKNPRTPVEELLLRWPEGPIISSVLMEKPGFQAGERVTLWVVRTQGKVFLKGFVDGKPSDSLGHEIPSKVYDEMFRQISSLQQVEPLRRERTPRGGFSGYGGFLSLYDRGESRQMLLTLEDFYSPDELKSRNLEADLRGGRLEKILEPLLSPPAEDDENALFCPVDKEQGETKPQTSPERATSVSSKNKKGCTPLMRASENGNFQAVQDLLKEGADVDATGIGNITPLMLAAKEGQLEIVKILLAAGADPNRKVGSFHGGVGTALMSAMDPRTKNRLAIMDAMIAAGAEVNPVGWRSPLTYAIGESDKLMIKALIARGADINLTAPMAPRH